MLVQTNTGAAPCGETCVGGTGSHRHHPAAPHRGPRLCGGTSCPNHAAIHPPRSTQRAVPHCVALRCVAPSRSAHCVALHTHALRCTHCIAHTHAHIAQANIALHTCIALLRCTLALDRTFALHCARALHCIAHSHCTLARLQPLGARPTRRPPANVPDPPRCGTSGGRPGCRNGGCPPSPPGSILGNVVPRPLPSLTPLGGGRGGKDYTSHGAPRGSCLLTPPSHPPLLAAHAPWRRRNRYKGCGWAPRARRGRAAAGAGGGRR